MTTMIPILRDFILDLDLNGEHMHEERITGAKIGLDVSAGSTYMRVYTVLTYPLLFIYLGIIVC